MSSSPSNVSKEILGKEQLRELFGSDLEGKALFEEVSTLFKADTENRLKKIQDANQSADFKALKFETHALKGSCGNIAAHRMQQLCVEIESFITTTDQPKISSLVNTLSDEFIRVQEALQTFKW